MASNKYLAFKVFLSILATFLIVIIGMWGYNNFTSARDTVNTTQYPAIRCVDYVYKVENYSYDGSMLEFRITNQRHSNKDITSLTIESGEEKMIMEKLIPVGLSREIQVEIKAESNFSVFPTGCGIYKEVLTI